MLAVDTTRSEDRRYAQQWHPTVWMSRLPPSRASGEKTHPRSGDGPPEWPPRRHLKIGAPSPPTLRRGRGESELARAETAAMTLQGDGTSDDQAGLDPRVTALRQRLNEALFEVNHGEYFRARVHGWIAYTQDVDVELPKEVAERISTRFEFARDGDAGDVATVDAFVIAYHAAETFWRYLFAVLDGSGPVRAPLLSMAGLTAGKTFNDRIIAYLQIGEDDIDELISFAFLPPEVETNWASGEPTLKAVREYLVLWWRALARYVTDWRNAYNAAKHGLAVGVRPVQLAFLNAEGSGPSVDLMNGPVMRTLEHEILVDSNGRKVKDPATGQNALRWFWMYRALDPHELVAQTIVTADLLDWLRAIAGARLLNRTGTPVYVRDEPKPLTLKRRTTMGTSFRIDLAAVPLPPEETAEIMARIQSEADDPEIHDGRKGDQT